MSNDTVKFYNADHKVTTAFFNNDYTNAPQYTSVHYNVFDSIILTDSISIPGLSGQAVLNNYNDLINTSPQFKFSQLYNNFFNFNASQSVFYSDDIKLDETFILTNLYTVPTTEIESKLVIQFEDSFFGMLKGKTIDNTQQIAKYKTGLASDLLKNILTDYNTSVQPNVGTPWTATTNSNDFIINPTMSVDELFDHILLYNFTAQSGNYVDAVTNIVKKDGNVFTGYDSKWTLTPINQKFLALYSKIQTNAKDVDLSDVLLESFAEGGSQNAAGTTGFVRGYSEIQEMQILRPDPAIVRDIYRNIIVESSDKSNNSLIDTLPIMRSYENFYKLFCNNPSYKLDVPYDFTQQIDVASANKNARRYSALYPSLEPGSTQALLYNTFLFNSTTIRFRVRGQLYRKPGYFIYLEPRQSMNDDAHYKQYVGYWFITDVQHIFKGNTYDNIITCVNPFVRK